MFLQHPAVLLPLRFIARIAFAASWGIILRGTDNTVHLTFMAILTALGSTLLAISYGEHVRTAGVALYGLLVAGESLAACTFVLAALGAYSAHLSSGALCLAAFGSTCFTLAGLSGISRHLKQKRDNTRGGPGSMP